jgi:hypothetical protein
MYVRWKTPFDSWPVSLVPWLIRKIEEKYHLAQALPRRPSTLLPPQQILPHVCPPPLFLLFLAATTGAAPPRNPPAGAPLCMSRSPHYATTRVEGPSDRGSLPENLPPSINPASNVRAPTRSPWTLWVELATVHWNRRRRHRRVDWSGLLQSSSDGPPARRIRR